VSNIRVWISVDSAWRRLSELAKALVASFVLVMLIRLVIRIPDMDGIDG
jgi:hypothetical protein